MHHGAFQPDDDHAGVLIERLARALHRFGLPSHRIEDALARVAGRLKVHGEFFATPTAVFASLTGSGGERTVLMRLDPGDVDLEKLSQLDALIDAVADGRLSAGRAVARLDAITTSPPRPGTAATIAAFGVASASAALFFGGGWREAAACAVIGLVVGLCAAYIPRTPARRGLFEPAAAFLAGLIAALAGAWMHPLSTWVAMCAGLIVLIPGLTLTISINELATRNLAAGSVRMIGALALFLVIGFGVAAGMKTASLWTGPLPAVEPAPPPGWTLPAALVLAPLSFTVLFRASWRDAGWIVAAGAVAFTAARLGAEALGIEMGAFLGAFAVGTGSNLFSRLLRRPASVTLVPGIMLLVPGSVGFRSISDLMAHDVVSGMETAFTMGLLGVALVTGLLLASVVVPPRSSL